MSNAKPRQRPRSKSTAAKPVTEKKGGDKAIAEKKQRGEKEAVVVNPNLIIFWGHTEEGAEKISGKAKYRFFSNWCPSVIKYKDSDTNKTITFASAEQFIAWYKVSLFGDEVLAERILKAVSAKEMPEGKDWGIAMSKIKALSNDLIIEEFDEKTWQKQSEKILRKVLTLKFEQNKDMLKVLLGTGEKTLAQLGDGNFWGIGMRLHQKGVTDETKWPGKNIMGKCLMKVREKLSEE